MGKIIIGGPVHIVSTDVSNDAAFGECHLDCSKALVGTLGDMVGFKMVGHRSALKYASRRKYAGKNKDQNCGRRAEQRPV